MKRFWFVWIRCARRADCLDGGMKRAKASSTAKDRRDAKKRPMLRRKKTGNKKAYPADKMLCDVAYLGLVGWGAK